MVHVQLTLDHKSGALEHKLKRMEQKMFVKVEEEAPEKTKNLIPKRHAKLDVFPDKEDLNDVVDS